MRRSWELVLAKALAGSEDWTGRAGTEVLPLPTTRPVSLSTGLPCAQQPGHLAGGPGLQHPQREARWLGGGPLGGVVGGELMGERKTGSPLEGSPLDGEPPGRAGSLARPEEEACCLRGEVSG